MEWSTRIDTLCVWAACPDPSLPVRADTLLAEENEDKVGDTFTASRNCVRHQLVKLIA